MYSILFFAWLWMRSPLYCYPSSCIHKMLFSSHFFQDFLCLWFPNIWMICLGVNFLKILMFFSEPPGSVVCCLPLILESSQPLFFLLQIFFLLCSLILLLGTLYLLNLSQFMDSPFGVSPSPSFFCLHSIIFLLRDSSLGCVESPDELTEGILYFTHGIFYL